MPQLRPEPLLPAHCPPPLDEMEEVAVELKKYNYRDAEKELLEKLLTAVEELDVDSCEEIMLNRYFRRIVPPHCIYHNSNLPAHIEASISLLSYSTQCVFTINARWNWKSILMTRRGYALSMRRM